MSEFRGLSVAVIIPLYNGGKFIEDSLKSVLAQTVKPAEILVVDDGSTDDGPAIVARLAERYPITLLRKPNGGQASARNFGVTKSKSPLIALLDQNDAWYPCHLEELAKPFSQNSDAIGWVYSNLDVTDEYGNIVHARLLDRVAHHPKTSLEKCQGEDMHILPSATLISRKAFLTVGGFDERLSGYGDDDLFIRMFCAGYLNVYINEPLSLWRHHSTNSGFSSRMIQSAAIYATKSLEAFPGYRSAIIKRFLRVSWWMYAESPGRETLKRKITPLLNALLPYLPNPHWRQVLLATILLQTRLDTHNNMKRLIGPPPEAVSSLAESAVDPVNEPADKLQSLPDDFDEAVYLAMHPDVRLAGVDAKEHFLTYGFKEGRAYKSTPEPRSRDEFLIQLLKYSSILEIGPFDRPVAPHFCLPTAEVAFADWLSTEELKSRARTIPERNPDTVPHISYIVKGKLADVIVPKFDCVVSSHMIEHTPDLVTHLNDVRSLLKPGGAYIFICPDKRQCFDHFLPESALPEVVTAFLEQRTRPPLRSVVEHRAFIRPDFANSNDPLKTPNENDWATILSAKQEFERSAYIDVHCWQFTAASLRELIEAISSLGVLARPARFETHQLGGEIGGLIQW